MQYTRSAKKFKKLQGEGKPPVCPLFCINYFDGFGVVLASGRHTGRPCRMVHSELPHSDLLHIMLSTAFTSNGSNAAGGGVTVICLCGDLICSV
jgi:hypothetical protein